MTLRGDSEDFADDKDSKRTAHAYPYLPGYAVRESEPARSSSPDASTITLSEQERESLFKEIPLAKLTTLSASNLSTPLPWDAFYITSSIRPEPVRQEDFYPQKMYASFLKVLSDHAPWLTLMTIAAPMRETMAKDLLTLKRTWSFSLTFQESMDGSVDDPKDLPLEKEMLRDLWHCLQGDREEDSEAIKACQMRWRSAYEQEKKRKPHLSYQRFLHDFIEKDAGFDFAENFIQKFKKLERYTPADLFREDVYQNLRFSMPRLNNASLFAHKLLLEKILSEGFVRAFLTKAKDHIDASMMRLDISGDTFAWYASEASPLLHLEIRGESLFVHAHSVLYWDPKSGEMEEVFDEPLWHASMTYRVPLMWIDKDMTPPERQKWVMNHLHHHACLQQACISVNEHTLSAFSTAQPQAYEALEKAWSTLRDDLGADPVQEKSMAKRT